MKKYVFAAIGALAIVVGGIDWLIGALVPHSRFLILVGAVAVTAAGFSYWWEKLQGKITLPMMGLAVAILCSVDPCTAGTHDVLIQPEITPIQPWNPNAVTGMEVWVIVGVIVVVGLACLLAFYFLRGCFPKSRSY